MDAKLAAALIAAQAEIKDPGQDGKNPHFKSRYTTLPGLVAAIRPVLNKHGIAVSQTTQYQDGVVQCSTLLIHESGATHEIPGSVPVGNKQDPQAVGSAITYARRYCLAAALCVVGDPDDDGEAAMPRSASKAMVPAKQPTAEEYALAISKAQGIPQLKAIGKDIHAAKKSGAIDETTAAQLREMYENKMADLGKTNEDPSQ